MLGSATLCAAISGAAFGDDILNNAFFKDSSTQVVARNFYFNRDFRNAASTAQSYREEWAQGFIGTFTSGFTPGTVGFGHGPVMGDDAGRKLRNFVDQL